MLLSSKCTMYKSATEAVSIWGWPLQTAGLLRTGFSQRSFTILSGRVTEVNTTPVEFDQWTGKLKETPLICLVFLFLSGLKEG